ncbi:MAG: DUF3667 domain-containing protein [Flavobacteriaceae bacterium]
MKTEKTYCKNYNAPVATNFCGTCGQKASVHKITFKETFQDLADSFFSVNAPFFKTLSLLFWNPGKLIREYLEGRRKTYYKPVAFFVLITVVYLLVRALIDYDPFQNSTMAVSDETKQQLLVKSRNFMLLNIDKFLFLFVFNLGLLLKLFFWKKYRLAEYIAIGFYFAGIYSLFTTLNMFYVQYINPNFLFLAMCCMVLYFCYAMVSFLQRRKFWVVLKSFVLFFLAIISYGFMAFGLSFLWIYSTTR